MANIVCVTVNEMNDMKLEWIRNEYKYRDGQTINIYIIEVCLILRNNKLKLI